MYAGILMAVAALEEADICDPRYIYIYIYIYMYTHIHTYICVHTHTHVCRYSYGSSCFGGSRHTEPNIARYEITAIGVLVKNVFSNATSRL